MITAALRSLRHKVSPWYRRIRYFGFSRYCPICGSHIREFVPFGEPPRPHARCPVCSSLERHRMIWAFIAPRLQSAGKQLTLLHVAPEPGLFKNLKRMPSIDYWSSSYDGAGTRIHADITKLPFENESIDVVLCSHVLEHVIDDAVAMREFMRVLRHGGWAVLQVPLDASRESTYEDPTITTPEARTKAFGQNDHVRIYGRDYFDRLRAAGFTVSQIPPEAIIPGGSVKCGLDPEEPLYFCEKSPANTLSSSL